MQVNVLRLTVSFPAVTKCNCVRETVCRQENSGVRWCLSTVLMQQTSLRSQRAQSVVGRGSRGTGEVASMRAGFRMMGRDMGGTPTCSEEAKGCRMRGD